MLMIPTILWTLFFFEEVGSQACYVKPCTERVEQTLPRIVAARKTMSLVQGDDVTEESAVVAELSSAAPLPTTMELLSDPSRRRIIASGFFLAFLSLGFEPLFALWNYTPISLGGLGREVIPFQNRNLALTQSTFDQ